MQNSLVLPTISKQQKLLDKIEKVLKHPSMSADQREVLREYHDFYIGVDRIPGRNFCPEK